MKHINIKISGLVQGVNFRREAMVKANELMLTGFAQNLPDGRLYIEAEGQAEDLEKFVQWCHEGPAYSRVDKVAISAGSLKNFDKFIIKY